MVTSQMEEDKGPQKVLQWTSLVNQYLDLDLTIQVRGLLGTLFL